MSTPRAGCRSGAARRLPQGRGASEDWAVILRALSDRTGRDLALRHAGRAARQADGGPSDLRRNRLRAGRRLRGVARRRRAVRGGGGEATRPSRQPERDFYMTNPIARASVTMAECSAAPRGRGRAPDRGGVARRARERLDHPLGLDAADARPGAAVRGGRAGQPRLSAARRPQDLGERADAERPERGRPLRPAAVLRGLPEVRAEGDHHSGGGGQVRSSCWRP